MFKLSKLNDNKYCVFGKGFAVEGNRAQILIEMHNHGVKSMDEAETGMDIVEEYDYAEFGINGYCMFGSNFERDVG